MSEQNKTDAASLGQKNNGVAMRRSCQLLRPKSLNVHPDIKT